VFCSAGVIEVIEGERIETPHTHGTGCTLASAIAVGLAQRMEMLAAIRRARAYLTAALRRAPGLGGGHGPLGHMVRSNDISG
jgi:hydroxymethylpyrimidine/phosphomethylpyrimidine kinase